MSKHIIVKLTDQEAIALLVAADLQAQVMEEGAGTSDAALTRATKKIENARVEAKVKR